jgi:hypothetical protein
MLDGKEFQYLGAKTLKERAPNEGRRYGGTWRTLEFDDLSLLRFGKEDTNWTADER